MSFIGDRFNIELPGEWEDQTVYHFRGPDDGDVSHTMSVTVTRHLQHDDVTQFAKQYTAVLLDNLQGVEVLKDEETSVAGCHQSYEFVYRWMPSDEIVTFNKYVFVIAEDLGFVFQCEFTKKTLKTIGSQFSEIVEHVLPGTYEPMEDE